MRNKLLQGISILCMIVSIGVVAGIIHAQTSEGCDLWDSTGDTTLPNPSSITFGPVAFTADDEVTVTYGLLTATTATVQLITPAGTQQETFTTGNSILSYTIPTDGDYSISVENTASDGEVSAGFDCDPAPVDNDSTSSLLQEPVVTGFTDGRINFLDAAAPIVVYPYQDELGSGVDIYLADGTLAYRATADDLANLPIWVDSYRIELSQTDGGTYRITAPQYNGKTYVLQFGAPYQHTGYLSYEVE